MKTEDSTSRSKNSGGSPALRINKKDELINKPISKMSDKTYRECYLSFVKDWKIKNNIVNLIKDPNYKLI